MSDKTLIPCHKNPELKLKQRFIFHLYVSCPILCIFKLQTFGIPQGISAS